MNKYKFNPETRKEFRPAMINALVDRYMEAYYTGNEDAVSALEHKYRYGFTGFEQMHDDHLIDEYMDCFNR